MTRRVIRSSVVLVATAGLVLAGGASAPAAVAPTTPDLVPTSLTSASYKLMRGWLTQYSGTAFARASSIGDPVKFRAALVSSGIRVDRRLDAVAQYHRGTITLSFNPKRVPPGDRLDRGGTIWHEVVHKIEADHGDTGGNTLWYERNVEYMTLVATKALGYLVRMEAAAARGAADSLISDYWQRFLATMNQAATGLPETAAYPPDLTQMYTWFGFDVDPARIARMYADGLSGLGGDTNAQLMRVFGALSHPQVGGLWTEDTGPCPGARITITQSGSEVTGISMDNSGADYNCAAMWVGSNIRWLSANTLAYDLTFTMRPNSGWYNGSHELTFAPDGRTASLAWRDTNGSSGSTTWSRAG